MPQLEYLGAFPGDVKEICLKSCAIEVDCWFGIRSVELRQCQSTKLFLNGEGKAFTVQGNLIQSLWEESKTRRDHSQAWDQIQYWSSQYSICWVWRMLCNMKTEQLRNTTGSNSPLGTLFCLKRGSIQKACELSHFLWSKSPQTTPHST